MEQKLPDWEISKLYSQAWQIVKKHPWPWVLGTASGIGSVAGFRSSSNIYQFFFPSSSPQPEKTNHVLGATPKVSSHLLQHTLASLPSWIYFALAGEIIMILLLALLVSLIFHGFATAALLEGIEKARHKEGHLSLKEISVKAITCIKPLIWLQVVPPLLLFLIILGGSILLTISVITAPEWAKFVFGLLLLAWFLCSLAAWILLSLASIWAPRLVIDQDTTAQQAFWAGVRLARGKLWPMLLLGLVNSVLSVIATILPAILLVLIFFVPTILLIVALAHVSLTFLPFLISFLVILLLGMAILFQFVNGVLSAFKATVWTLAYHVMKGDYER